MLYERYLRAYAEQFRKTDRNMWNYEDGCVLIGLRALYQATGDAFYFDVLNSFMERYIEPDGTIRRYVAEEYNLDYIPAAARCIPCMTRPASRATARPLKRWKNSCATSRAPLRQFLAQGHLPQPGLARWSVHGSAVPCGLRPAVWRCGHAG